MASFKVTFLKCCVIMLAGHFSLKLFNRFEVGTSVIRWLDHFFNFGRYNKEPLPNRILYLAKIG